MLFGHRDKLLRGDDNTSEALKSPITIYAGDGLEEGFNFVRVSLIEIFFETPKNHNKQLLAERALKITVIRKMFK